MHYNQTEHIWKDIPFCVGRFLILLTLILFCTLPAHAYDSINLHYDDRYSFRSEIKSIENQVPTSFQTGTETLDTSVLTISKLDRHQVIATGCGDAVVNLIDGNQVHVNVEKSQISLLLIAGQSNGEGRPSYRNKLEKYRKQWVKCDEGTVYSSYGPSDDRENMDMYEEVCWYDDTRSIGALSIENYETFLPVNLTDNTQNDIYNSTNKLTDALGAIGKGGLDSSLGYRWNQLTGEKVWILNAAQHGSTIASWDPDLSDDNFMESVLLYQGAETILSKEIKAGHFQLSHKGVFWFQGESDGETDSETYSNYFCNIVESFENELSGNGISGMEKPIEFVGVIIPRATLTQPNAMEDFALTGPRLSQYYYAISSDLPIVYMASNVVDKWNSDKAVETYFLNKYGDAENYAQRLPLADFAAKLPKKMSRVHPKVHFTQLAYNEIGSDAAENICYAKGYATPPVPQADVEITIVGQDGINSINDETVRTGIGVPVPLVIRISPAYLTDTANLSLSNASLTVGGLVMESSEEGTLSVQSGDIRAIVKILSDKQD